MKWTKKSRISVAFLCVALATAGLVTLSQMNQVAEAAILEPVQSQTLEPIFHDDFSGDLSNWTVLSGDWMIEDGKLRCSVTDGVVVPHIIYVNTPLTDFVFEAKLQKISGNWAGLMFRGSSPPSSSGEYYLVLLGMGTNNYWVGKRSHDQWLTLQGWSNLGGLDVSVGAEVKVYFKDSTLIVYIEGTQVYSGSDSFRSDGAFGLVASDHTSNTQWYFDDINVTVPIKPSFATYRLAVRSGATQIVITCKWAGSGNITIANLTSPTTTYYETDMSIYERTSFSSQQSTFFNIKRGALTIAATTTPETWILNLTFNGVTTYEVSAETS